MAEAFSYHMQSTFGLVGAGREFAVVAHSLAGSVMCPTVCYPSSTRQCLVFLIRLLGTSVDDGWWVGGGLDGAAAGAAGLDGLDDALRLGVVVRDLAEDDVAAVEPRGHDGGDEELGAVGVGAGVGHREHEWLAVVELEVLVRELLAPDGLSTGALYKQLSASRSSAGDDH